MNRKHTVKDFYDSIFILGCDRSCSPAIDSWKEIPFDKKVSFLFSSTIIRVNLKTRRINNNEHESP